MLLERLSDGLAECSTSEFRPRVGSPCLWHLACPRSKLSQISFSERIRDFDVFVPQNLTLLDEKIGVRQVLGDPFSSIMARIRKLFGSVLAVFLVSEQIEMFSACPESVFDVPIPSLSKLELIRLLK